MQITYKFQQDFDFYYFNKLIDSNSILLPVDISIGDLVCIIQSSLDQIKGIFLIQSSESLSVINYSECKSTHFTSVDDKFLFLNYSIRNSLSLLNNSTIKVKSFGQIQKSLLHILQKTNQ